MHVKIFILYIIYSRNQFIVAGSDDGLIFVWEKITEKNLLILKGDNFVVNCIQPHPSEFLFATSSISSEIKLWSPLPDVRLLRKKNYA